MPLTVPDAPLGIGHAARVAVNDGVIGDPGAEGIVLGPVLRGRPRPLLGLVGAASGLLTRLASRGGRGTHGARGDPAAA